MRWLGYMVGEWGYMVPPKQSCGGLGWSLELLEILGQCCWLVVGCTADIAGIKLLGLLLTGSTGQHMASLYGLP